MNRRLDRVVSFRTAAALTVAAACASLVASFAARATTGGSPTSMLAYSGVLSRAGQPMTTAHTAKFSFKKAGRSVCDSHDIHINPDHAGRFTVAIPIDLCPSSLFDGEPIGYDVFIDGLIVASEPILAVPQVKYAEQVGAPDCPVTHERDANDSGAAVVCRRQQDEIVLVGTGPASFWIDRYEASVWDSSGTMQYGIEGSYYPSTFPSNGQGLNADLLYARSVRGVLPSAATWFQANRACRASGKRLARVSEWLAAATGTPDITNASAHPCNVKGPTRSTGQGTICTSNWGAQDMIGNAHEWTSEWNAGVGEDPSSYRQWPPEYGDDGSWNVVGTSFIGGLNGSVYGIPAAIGFGGGWWGGYLAGIFAYAPSGSPMLIDYLYSSGFRCVIPR